MGFDTLLALKRNRAKVNALSDNFSFKLRRTPALTVMEGKGSDRLAGLPLWGSTSRRASRAEREMLIVRIASLFRYRKP